MYMTVAERKAICEMLVRMERQKEFSKKLGLVNTSVLKNTDYQNDKKQYSMLSEK